MAVIDSYKPERDLGQKPLTLFAIPLCGGAVCRKTAKAPPSAPNPDRPDVRTIFPDCAPDAMRQLFGYSEQPNFPPRWNIAPTQPVAVVMQDSGTRHFRLMRWGFIPGWVKDPATVSLMINARAETAAGKPAFRAAMRHRRCLVPASGFYEWSGTGGEKQPWHIAPKDGSCLALGAIWEGYMAPDGSEIDTVAILTTGPNRLMRRIHDRMPVIIPPAAFAAWLDPMSQMHSVDPLLGPAPDTLLEAAPVSSRVNSVRNDDSGLVAPLAEPLAIDPPDERQGSLF